MEQIDIDADMCQNEVAHVLGEFKMVDKNNYFQNPHVELGCKLSQFREGRLELDMKEWIGLGDEEYKNITETIKERLNGCPAAQSLQQTLAQGLMLWVDGGTKWLFCEPKFLDILVKEVLLVLMPEIEVQDQIVKTTDGERFLLRDRIAQKLKSFWLECFCFRNSAFLYQYKCMKQMMNTNYEQPIQFQLREIEKALKKMRNVEKKGLDLNKFKEQYLQLGIEEDPTLAFFDKIAYKQVMLLAGLRIVLWVDSIEDKGIRYFYQTIKEMGYVLNHYMNQSFGKGRWEHIMDREIWYSQNKQELTRNEKNKIYKELVQEFDFTNYWCPFRTGDIIEEEIKCKCDEVLLDSLTGRVSDTQQFEMLNQQMIQFFLYEYSWLSCLNMKVIYEKRMCQKSYTQQDLNMISKLAKKMFIGDRDGLKKKRQIEDLIFSTLYQMYSTHLNEKVQFCQCKVHLIDGNQLTEKYLQRKVKFWTLSVQGKTMEELRGEKFEKGIYYQYLHSFWEVNGVGPYLTKRGIFSIFEQRPIVHDFLETFLGKSTKNIRLN